MAQGKNPIDPVKLDRLAEVAIKVGLRLEPGQDLVMTAPMSALPLVRKITEHAYKAGAGIVQPIFSTSMSSCPTDWQASSRNGMPCFFATAPISAAGLMRPPLVGTWVMAINFTF